MQIAMATGWTPQQVAELRPRDFATVLHLLTTDDTEG